MDPQKSTESLVLNFLMADWTVDSRAEIEATPSIPETEFPIFLYTGYLDFSFDSNPQIKWAPQHFVLSSDENLQLSVLDVSTLSQSSIRLYLSSRVRSNSTGKVKVTLSLESNQFWLKKTEFVYHLPRIQRAGDLLYGRNCPSAFALDSREVLIMGGYDETNLPVKELEIYDTLTQTSRVMASLPEGIWNFQVSKETNGDFLISGGLRTLIPTSGQHYNKFIYRISPASARVTHLGELSLGRENHSQTLVQNELYILGGQVLPDSNGSNALTSSIEKLDLNTGTVITLPIPLQSHLYHHQSYFNSETNSIVMVGGKHHVEEAPHRYQLIPQILNLSSFSVSSLGFSLLFGRKDFELLSPSSENFQLVGGSNLFPQTSLERCDLKTRQCQTIGFLKFGRRGGGRASYSNSQEIFMGGVSSNSTNPNNPPTATSSIELFDRRSNESFVIGSMIHPRKCFAVAKTKQGFFIFGDTNVANRSVERYGIDD